MNELKNKINKIICNLIVIDSINKDIHYTAFGEAFYAIHTFVEKFNFAEDIDFIKESILLGNGIRPLSSVDYLMEVISILPPVIENDNKANFRNLLKVLVETKELINEIKAEDTIKSILDDTNKKILQYIGLINLQLE